MGAAVLFAATTLTTLLILALLAWDSMRKASRRGGTVKVVKTPLQTSIEISFPSERSDPNADKPDIEPLPKVNLPVDDQQGRPQARGDGLASEAGGDQRNS